MQPTGLSGRPVNPSFLLTAKNRYACGQVECEQTATHHRSAFPYDHISSDMILNHDIKVVQNATQPSGIQNPMKVHHWTDGPTETFLMLQVIK